MEEAEVMGKVEKWGSILGRERGIVLVMKEELMKRVVERRRLA